jgi:AraC-like DNA-binding protein
VEHEVDTVAVMDDALADRAHETCERWEQLPGWFVIRVVEDLQAQGADPGASLAAFGIDRSTLRKDAPLDVMAATRWTEHVLDRFGQPGLGLRFGAGLQPADFGMLGFSLLSAGTFGEAVSLWLRFGSLMRPYQGTTVRTLDDGRLELAIVERDPPVYGARMRAYCNERWLAAWCQLAQILLGPGRHLDQVHCAYPDPGARDAYVSTFGCLIRFDQPRTMLRFAPGVATAPTRHANAEAQRLCEAQCELLLSRVNGSRVTTAAVRRLLLSQAGRLPDLTQAAAAMDLSEASLRGRLRSEGTTYTELLHGVRMQLAVDYLRCTTLRVSEVAARLGYADESAFNRAFSRDHHRTALAFRRAMRPAG